MTHLSLDAKAREIRRLRAIKEIAGGRKQNEVASALGASRTSVSKWVERYRDQGAEGLLARAPGRPARRGLRCGHTDELRALLLSRGPEQLGAPGLFWTWRGVRSLLASRLGCEVSRWTVSRYIADWGLRVPRPLGSLDASAPHVAQRWFQSEYRTMKASARKRGASLMFLECAGVFREPGAMTHDLFDILWLVGGRGEWAFIAYPKAIGDTELEDAFNRALRQWDQGLVLIAHGASKFRGERLRSWLELNQKRFALEMLDV